MVKASIHLLERFVLAFRVGFRATKALLQLAHGTGKLRRIC